MKKQYKRAMVTILFMGFIVALAVFLFFALEGSSEISGEYPEPQHSTALICESDKLSYPFFDYDGSNAKNTKITAIFDQDEINSISLTHTLYYDDRKAVLSSEALNHAAYNHGLSDYGFNADSFSAVFSKIENRLQLSIYVSKDEMEANTLRFFFLNGAFPTNIEETKSEYEELGFSCKR